MQTAGRLDSVCAPEEMLEHLDQEEMLQCRHAEVKLY